MPLIVIISCFSIIKTANAQSVLLIKPDTEIYDTYKESRAVKLKISEKTWVNYKGKNGEYFKVSNFFGKDKYYPLGVFEGYIHISSVLDTASRKEIDNLEYSTNLPGSIAQQTNPTDPGKAVPPITDQSVFDINNYYLGMPEHEANSIKKSPVSVAGHTFQVELSFSSLNTLSKIDIRGQYQDALEVDGLIKRQLSDLRSHYTGIYGNPSSNVSYPSFLELEDNKIHKITTWDLADKTLILGIGEQNDLFYPCILLIKD